ncbi:hypothetical protein [Xenorhabdus littoralis]|uniref:hypothetical protein n=1 Tax=Xenorhabdus littoralis TaxID=2582835 RepID=UPI0029E820A3|nr:hypothetical protein [Xenorhabdus sp. psl]
MIVSPSFEFWADSTLKCKAKPPFLALQVPPLRGLLALMLARLKWAGSLPLLLCVI